MHHRFDSYHLILQEIWLSGLKCWFAIPMYGLHTRGSNPLFSALSQALCSSTWSQALCSSTLSQAIRKIASKNLLANQNEQWAFLRLCLRNAKRNLSARCKWKKNQRSQGQKDKGSLECTQNVAGSLYKHILLVFLRLL